MASRVFSGCRAKLAAAKSGSSSVSTKEISSSAADSVSITKKPKAAKSTSPGSGLLKSYPVSPALGDFMGGVASASRVDAVKNIWEHIKVNNLQDPANKKLIHVDAKLKTIFEGKDQVAFHEITKLLSAHFVKILTS